MASAFAELTRLGGSGSEDVPVIGMRPNQWTPFLNVTHDDFTGFDIAGLNAYGEPNQKYVYDDATSSLQRGGATANGYKSDVVTATADAAAASADLAAPP